MNKIIIALAIFLLMAGVCSADDHYGGMPLTTVQEGVVSGGVFNDNYHYNVGDQYDQTSGAPNTVDKTFTLPDYTDIEWAMLMTTAYVGSMSKDFYGTANVTFNDVVLGNETLNVSYNYIIYGGNDNSAFPDHGTNESYKIVNDHVNRVTSDYLMWYDVTDLVEPGDNTASVHTDQITSNFDGRIKLVTLVVAYNDGSDNEIYYWVNRGHDVDSYKDDDYIGSTDFIGSPFGVQDASLTAVYMASKDGDYTFNGNSLSSGTPQGKYSGSNTWDVTSIFNQNGDNTMTYDCAYWWYKIPLVILTAPVIVTDVAIDILPGTFPNEINLGSGGTVPVAIFSTDTFDATTVDPLTVTLAGAPVELKPNGQPMAASEDVNDDGLLDLVVHVITAELQLTSGDTEATLLGTTTYCGECIEGTDSVCIVP
jgi:hypothetical protein